MTSFMNDHLLDSLSGQSGKFSVREVASVEWEFRIFRVVLLRVQAHLLVEHVLLLTRGIDTIKYSDTCNSFQFLDSLFIIQGGYKVISFSNKIIRDYLTIIVMQHAY